MKPQISHIQKKLNQRKKENAFRELSLNNNLIDFCSNDYLGFSTEKEIHNTNGNLTQYGATGSRLISGNHQTIIDVEQFLANFYNSESALIFNSGYTANLGLFSCLPQRGDTVIYDELIHASIRDGMRLSNPQSYSFSHNNPSALESKLTKAKGRIYVVIESIYSMDGDEAPLKEISEICNKYNAALIVDEAHAVGVYGDKGEGLVTQLQLENEIFARIVTFGKAWGCHGAAILSSNSLRDYLINYSRPFIYTTALPLTSIQIIKNAHTFLTHHTDRRIKLKELITHFNKQTITFELPTISSQSAIQCIIIPGNNQVKQVTKKIQVEGFDVRPILSPTVSEGKERIRICLHSYNDKTQIDDLIALIKKYY